MHIERDDGLMMVLLQCIIAGRFSKGYIELRRGETSKSDRVMAALLDVAAGLPALGTPRPPFFALQMSNADFSRSAAYRNMVELGLSPEEMALALRPYALSD